MTDKVPFDFDAAIAALRIWIDLGWRWGLLPFTVAAYFAGQFAGGRLRRLMRSAPE